jgi:hypothetical protein
MAIAFVGAWAGIQGNNVTSVTNAGRTSVAGNFIACGISINTAVNFVGIADSYSNTWLQAAPSSGWYAGGGFDSSRLHDAADILGGTSHTITLTMSPASFATIQAAEYSFGATGTLDQIAHDSLVGSSTSLDSTATPATTAADELLVGFGCQAMTDGTFTWTAGAGYTLRSSTNNANAGSTAALEDRIVSATGAYNATMSDALGTGPLGWDMLIATFREGGGGGGDPPQEGGGTGSGMPKPVAQGWT